MRVGAEWYGGNTLLTIPDLSNFLVEMQIAEEYRGRLNLGAPATVTVEAVPGLTLTGKLEEIAAALPARAVRPIKSQGFRRQDQTRPDRPARLVSGMTARVEIITDSLENVLNVPIECVFNVDGKTGLLRPDRSWP